MGRAYQRSVAIVAVLFDEICWVGLIGGFEMAREDRSSFEMEEGDE
jgi:hypothetical protein